MIELLGLIVLGVLGIALLQGALALFGLLLRMVLRLGSAALIGAVIWAVIQMLV